MAIIQIEALQCDQCGHIWIPKSDEFPSNCAKCKSPRWNKSQVKETFVRRKLGDIKK